MTEEKEIPLSVEYRRGDIETLKTINAFLIDEGHLKIAKRLHGVITAYEHFIKIYDDLKHEEGKQR